MARSSDMQIAAAEAFEAEFVNFVELAKKADRLENEVASKIARGASVALCYWPTIGWRAYSGPYGHTAATPELALAALDRELRAELATARNKQPTLDELAANLGVDAYALA